MTNNGEAIVPLESLTAIPIRLLPRSTPTLRIAVLDDLSGCKQRKLQCFVERLNYLSARSCNIAFSTATATYFFCCLGYQLTGCSFDPCASRCHQCNTASRCDATLHDSRNRSIRTHGNCQFSQISRCKSVDTLDHDTIFRLRNHLTRTGSC